MKRIIFCNSTEIMFTWTKRHILKQLSVRYPILHTQTHKLQFGVCDGKEMYLKETKNENKNGERRNKWWAPKSKRKRVWMIKFHLGNQNRCENVNFNGPGFVFAHNNSSLTRSMIVCIFIRFIFEMFKRLLISWLQRMQIAPLIPTNKKCSIMKL